MYSGVVAKPIIKKEASNERIYSQWNRKEWRNQKKDKWWLVHSWMDVRGKGSINICVSVSVDLVRIP